MNYEPRTKRGFTLVELMVAMGILAMVLVSASVIFKMSINTHRFALANAEIMQKLRAVTDQLNSDFGGLQKDMPLLIWFQKDTTASNQIYDPNRYDQIMFFATGDFQSVQQYNKLTHEPEPGNKLFTVVGNAARIFYGQAQMPNASGPGEINEEKQRILARRCHILTEDPNVGDWPNKADVAGSFDDTWDNELKNERYEHDKMSLSEWRIVDISNWDEIVSVCFDERPFWDKGDPNTYHKLFCEGMVSFAIQWGYWDKKLCWFPSNDPDGDGSDSDSHFSPGVNEFGVYFNIENMNNHPWYRIDEFAGMNFWVSGCPKALKFTFRLCDSKGIIKEYDAKQGRLKTGRTFTHIVYLK